MNGPANRPVLIEFKSEDGQSFFIETEDDRKDSDGFSPAGSKLDRVARKVSDVPIDKVLCGLRPIVSGITSAINNVDLKPSEVQAELSVKISADLNLMVTKMAGEAQLKIALKWKLS